MKIISLIDDSGIIKKILNHLGLIHYFQPALANCRVDITIFLLPLVPIY